MTPAGRQRRETVRMQAAELFEQKIEPPEVARRLRVSMKSANQWQQLWRGAACVRASGWLQRPRWLNRCRRSRDGAKWTESRIAGTAPPRGTRSKAHVEITTSHRTGMRPGRASAAPMPIRPVAC
ncbi:helix-turn-helix domain-containing protein [Streptomyces sp. NPDC059629]|uniref:helix-turn-helix domain-containing protein n=1 Tax=Streptomyces sp. NPDC059629 TaxID=3346889 RepID=UPI00367EE8C7